MKWTLDPTITFLNHGSFGACPVSVLERQQEIRNRLEKEPVFFFTQLFEELLDESRSGLARFVGTQPQNLVFVNNATMGVNTILRSYEFRPGDEIIITNHGYNACTNAAEVIAKEKGVVLKMANIPFPLESGEEVLEAILSKTTPKTRIALVDHITSPTALIFPIEKLSQELQKRNVDLLVDGAHAPGMIPLDLDALHVPFYTANCHKWLCAPKGAAFLYVHPSRQKEIRPLSISHGHNSNRTDKSKFQLEFDWTGTQDPSAWLSVNHAIEHIENSFSGGWEALMRANHELVLSGRDLLCEALNLTPPAPDQLLGSMATLPLPVPLAGNRDVPDPLQQRLFESHQIEVPLFSWPALNQRFIRISAQIYNRPEDYARLSQAILGYL